MQMRLGVTPRDGLLAIALGLLGAAAYWPFCLWPLALVSIALFLQLLRYCSFLEARNIGLLYGLAYASGTMYWFFHIFAFLAISLIAIFAAYFGVLTALIAWTRGRNSWVRSLLVALFAVAIEWLRGDAWYLRFPWYGPTHALAESPMWIAPARWLGTYGLSFVIWFIVALGAFGRFWMWAGFGLIPLSVLLLPSFAPADHKAMLIQVEDGNPDVLFPRTSREEVDLAVMPEFAYHFGPEAVIKGPQGPGLLAKTLHAPVVFGAVRGTYGEKGFENIAAVVDEDGRLIGTFTKQRPIPLFNDGVPGKERPVFPTRQGVLGVAICYDFDGPAIAASLTRDNATVLVVPTYDAMSWSRTQHEHHERLLRLRAVEKNRWIVRSASSGRSETIDPHGYPSQEGVEIGKTDFAIVSYGHCD